MRFPIRPTSLRALSRVQLRHMSEAAEAAKDECYVDLHGLSTRWEKMPLEERQYVQDYLEVKQGFSWSYLTRDEKQAAYYLCYGKWGPRSGAAMTSAEFAMRSMTTLLLFGVAGFAFVNYSKEQKVVAAMEAAEEMAGSVKEE